MFIKYIAINIFFNMELSSKQKTGFPSLPSLSFLNLLLNKLLIP